MDLLELLGEENYLYESALVALPLAVATPVWFYLAGIRYPKNAIRNRFARVFDLRLAAGERLTLPDANA